MSTEKKTLLIKADKVWDGLAKGLLEGPQEIFIVDGVIKEMGRTVNLEADSILEFGSDYTLTPGFIDCHVHSTLLPTIKMLSGSVSEKTLYSLEALSILLGNGFTTVRDLGCFDPNFITIGLRNLIRNGGIIGPRMLVAPHMLSARGGHGDYTSSFGSLFKPLEFEVADGVPSIIRAVREDIRQGAEWIKFAATGGFTSPSSDPSQTTYSQEEMNALVSTALDLGISTTTHAYGDEGVRRAVMAGVRSVEHASLVKQKTLDTIMEKEYEAKEKGIEKWEIFIVPTQFAILHDAYNVGEDEYWKNRLPWERAKYIKYKDKLIETAKNLAKSEVPIAFGSDAGTFDCRHNRKEFQAMVKYGGFLPLQALKSATSMAARLLDRPDLGVLAAGKTADIIALKGDPLKVKDISAVGKVRFIMKEGIVYAKSSDDAQYPELGWLLENIDPDKLRIIPTPTGGWKDDPLSLDKEFLLEKNSRV